MNAIAIAMRINRQFSGWYIDDMMASVYMRGRCLIEMRVFQYAFMSLYIC